MVAVASDRLARVATLVFAFSLSGLFAGSAAYHRGRWTDAAKLRMKRVDHSMIFVLIAGTYTPFCLLVIRGWWGGALLIAVWTGAVAGIGLKLLSVERLRAVSGTMYIVLGWAVVVAFPRLVAELSTLELSLVVGGGLLYTLGAIVLLRRRPDPDPLVRP